jgi:L-amino acid N-acyltransferase YncA/ADP-ribose pyrophosphatase YjhB (NUDIX family)
VVIRPATSDDADAIWDIFSAVIAGRDTYAFHPDTPRGEGVGYWFGDHVTSYVAETDGRVVGMYKLIPNTRGLGSHVANASFMVHPSMAGRGIGRALGDRCLYEARRQGYDAMQFNFVVSTNTRAVALWQRLGFAIVGTIPEAFQHGRLGLVDAYVMHRHLSDIVLTFGDAREAPAQAAACAYIVLSDQHRRIAIRASDAGVLLPGGGIHTAEAPVDAAVRHAREHCGLQALPRRAIGRAIQHVSDGARPVATPSAFFAATLAPACSEGVAEHGVHWVPAEEAERAVTRESHAWAVACWRRLHV